MGIDAITKTDKGVLNAPSTNAAWGDWIAATDLRNFALMDPLLDWLNLFGVTVGFGVSVGLGVSVGSGVTVGGKVGAKVGESVGSGAVVAVLTATKVTVGVG